MVIDRIPSFAELLYKVKNDAGYFNHLVQELTVNVTEMFRDPMVFRSLGNRYYRYWPLTHL